MTFFEPVTSIIHTMSYLELFLILISLFVIGTIFYRAYFHPFSRFPGPFLWSISRLPMAYSLLRGRLPYRIAEIHDKYCSVIRLAPNEISFVSDAWQDIYGKPYMKPELRKDTTEFMMPLSGVIGLGPWPCSDKEHNRYRGIFAPAFTGKSLRAQEPIISKYIDLLISKLHEVSKNPLNICEWYNFTTFDTISDLIFGDSFHCLEKSALHPWVETLCRWVQGAAMIGMTQKFWPLTPILMYCMPKSLAAAADKHEAFTRQLLNERLAWETVRSDFITPLIDTLDTPAGMSYQELVESCRALIVGGSETTATALSAVTYLLSSNPSILEKLQAEIRSVFKASSEINMASVGNLKYIQAVLTESLRIFPPFPGNNRRFTPPEGCTVTGIPIPGNLLVVVDVYAANQSRFNFTRPHDFVPDRWLADCPEEFKDDNRKVCQPFAFGPRNCIGKHLALMQIRLILARVVFDFDCELQKESKHWMEGMPVYSMFEKPKLMVKLVSVTHT